MVSRYYQLLRRKYPLPQAREVLYNSLEERVGGTNLVKLKGLHIPGHNEIYAKLEYENPSGSHFDRIYVGLLRRAEHAGLIAPGVTPLMEVSSGNAGTAFAFAARELGFLSPTVVIPEDAPKARIMQIEAYGGKVVLSKAGEYMRAANQKGKELEAKDNSDKLAFGQKPEQLFWASKNRLPEEGIRLYHRIVDEALDQARAYGVKSFDYFVGPVGTGTTISGIGARLRQFNPKAKIVAVDHEKTSALSHLISTSKPKSHAGAVQDIFGFTPLGVPLNRLKLNPIVLDSIAQNGVINISDKDLQHCKNLIQKHFGLDVGVTGHAALAGALKLARTVNGKKFIILFSNRAWKDSGVYPE